VKVVLENIMTLLDENYLLYWYTLQG